MANPYPQITIRTFWNDGQNLSIQFKDRNDKKKVMRIAYSMLADLTFLGKHIAHHFPLVNWEKNGQAFADYLMTAKAPAKKKVSK